MNTNYEQFRAKVFSAMQGLADECPDFADAQMLVAASDVTASLKRSTVHKNIDTEWVDKIEETLPYLDLIVRNPTIMIEDVDEILPVELSRNIGEKTIKHLAQHTNMILTITEKDEVIPQKLLNVYHEETLLTYENKFINTLLVRLSAFVDKRYKLLRGGYGTERNYQLRYATEFEHYPSEYGGRNLAKVKLSIDLSSPISETATETEAEANERYHLTLARIQKISNALMSYMSSSYVRSLGRNYIRPPVIRTNAILKNKNMRVCLNLWEYIESFDKAGFSFVNDEYTEMPSDDYISDLYSSVALQYTDFYNGVAENPEDNRLLANRRLAEVYPDFDSSFDVEDLEDYQVYDSEYKKTVPVSRLMNNRKKLSEDEKRLRIAIIVALKADEQLNEEELAQEMEERRLAREKRLAEEEARRRAEEEARLRAEEEARRLAEEEEARRLAEEAARLVSIRYKRSFLARYTQSDESLQDSYTILKNEILSYRGVKSRISWSKETYKRGRMPIAKLDVKGKSLYLWLALDPTEFEDTKYRFKDVRDQRIGEDHPMLLKIRSPRSLKYAIELVAILMEKLEIPRIEREEVDYRVPYHGTDELIEMGLIKVVLPAGATLDENTQTVKADIQELITGEPSAAAAAEAEETEEEPTEEPSDEVLEEVVETVPDIETEDSLAASSMLDLEAYEIEEANLAAQMTEIEENSLAIMIDDFINSDEEEQYAVITVNGASQIVRRNASVDEKHGFVYADASEEELADSSAGILIPYTRAQYLALPRKKKKSVLMMVKKLTAYRNTLAILDMLKASKTENPRILKRIRLLEEKLAADEKTLPKAALWEKSVQRLKK